MNRRNFLHSMRGTGVKASPAPQDAPLPKVDLKQQPLRPGEVKLTRGLLRDRFMVNAQRTFAIPPDDILLPFLRAKGLPTRGKELNGEYAAKVQTGQYPGLYSSFWMCGAANIARWSGDPSHRATLVSMVHELAKAQEPDGYLLGLNRAPHERWSNADFYCLVRQLVRALLDTYELTGDKLALDLARGQMDCIYNSLEKRTGRGGGIVLKNMYSNRVTPVTGMSMGPYKLVQVNAQLFMHTGDERYLELADMCVDLPMINALADGSKHDPLVGRHSWTWTDCLMGIYQIGLATGNPRYVQAAVNGWQLIRDRHTFITGSMSSGEHFQLGSDGWQLQEDQHAQETCCAFELMSFGHTLLQGTGEMRYGDGIEMPMYNHLFVSQSPTTGDFCYYVDLEGKDKPYDAPPAHAYHCCDGNALTALGRMAGMIYGKTSDGFAINLYAGSEATADGVKITQETDYPESGTVVVRVDPDQPRRFTMQYRIPQWSSTPPEVMVNGQRLEANGMIAREWKRGDTVQLEFAVPPTLVHDTRFGVERVALRRGPVVYAATWSDGLPVRMSRPYPPQGALSATDVCPYVPAVIASSIGDFEAEALLPAVPGIASAAAPRVKVRFIPFYAVTEGKYSVWLPAVRA